MEAVEQPQTTEDLRLLLSWVTESDRKRTRRAGTVSILAHVLVTIGLLLVPRQVFQMKEEPRHVIPLTAPPAQITQTAPNPGKVSKEFNLQSFRPRAPLRVPPRAKLPPPAAPSSPPPSLPEPPKIDQDVGGPGPPVVAQAPQIKAEEPKLAFETPSGAGPGKNPGIGRLAAPSASVAEAMQNLAHRGVSSGIVVGDDLNQLPAGRAGSSLQLLSDPMGADFGPYLQQVLYTVKRNWFSVMPESAKLGRRGTVAVQFAIARNGSVTKVVFGAQSGADALDRAAVASISMSNPFPPLPTEFRGNVIRLQFTFLYNSASQSTIR